MDNCMTCRNMNQCDIFLDKGTNVGCPGWIPDRLDIRRSINAGRPVRQNEPQDDLRAAKGIVLGLFIGLVLWASIWIAIVLIR